MSKLSRFFLASLLVTISVIQAEEPALKAYEWGVYGDYCWVKCSNYGFMGCAEVGDIVFGACNP